MPFNKNDYDSIWAKYIQEERLIDYSVFDAVSAVFQPYNGGRAESWTREHQKFNQS